MEKHTNPITEEMISDKALNLGYSPSLISNYLDIMSPEDLSKFIEFNEKGIPLALRINTLLSSHHRVTERLKKDSYNLKQITWVKNGYFLPKKKKGIGNHTSYLLGEYYLQNPASQLVVECLNPQKNDLVVDLAAAPGGKTSYISQLMENSGIVINCDPHGSRIFSLVSNLARLGVLNSITVKITAQRFVKFWTDNHLHTINKLLLDAPCTGDGLIIQQSSLRTLDSHKLTKAVERQKNIIESLHPLLENNNCDLIYATCSLNKHENENILSHLTNTKPSNIYTSCLEDNTFGEKEIIKFQNNITLQQRRLYPHLHFPSVGFFFTKLCFRNYSNTNTNNSNSSFNTEEHQPSTRSSKTKMISLSNNQEYNHLKLILSHFIIDKKDDFSDYEMHLEIENREKHIQFKSRPLDKKLSTWMQNLFSTNKQKNSSFSENDIVLVSVKSKSSITLFLTTYSCYKYANLLSNENNIVSLGLPLLTISSRKNSTKNISYLNKWIPYPFINNISLHPGILHILKTCTHLFKVKIGFVSQNDFLYGKNCNLLIPKTSFPDPLKPHDNALTSLYKMDSTLQGNIKIKSKEKLNSSDDSHLPILVCNLLGDLLGIASISKENIAETLHQSGDDDNTNLAPVIPTLPLPCKNIMDLGWYLRKGE